MNDALLGALLFALLILGMAVTLAFTAVLAYAFVVIIREAVRDFKKGGK